jgi:hypothetical protein
LAIRCVNSAASGYDGRTGGGMVLSIGSVGRISSLETQNGRTGRTTVFTAYMQAVSKSYDKCTVGDTGARYGGDSPAVLFSIRTIAVGRWNQEDYTGMRNLGLVEQHVAKSRPATLAVSGFGASRAEWRSFHKFKDLRRKSRWVSPICG